MKFEYKVSLTLLLEADDITNSREAILCVSEFMNILTEEQKNDNPSIKNWSLTNSKEICPNEEKILKPDPNCKNCSGTGYFCSGDGYSHPAEELCCSCWS